MHSLFAMIFVCLALSACKFSSNSMTKVIDGTPVKNLSEANGTYQIFTYDSTDKLIYSASTVAIEQGGSFNTFITNAHVIKDISKIDRSDIIDIHGGLVARFFPNKPGVKLYYDPGFDSSKRSLSDSMDIGAIIFENNIERSLLTHGTARIASKSLTKGDKIKLIGGGYGDYRVTQKPSDELKKEFHNDFKDEAAFKESTLSGFLRRGTNDIVNHFAPDGQYRGGYIIEGVAKYTVSIEGKSVSAPGDSGGGSYNAANQLIGIMQGGNPYTPEGVESSAANSAYSFILDILQQRDFFEKISSMGSHLNPNKLGVKASNSTISNPNPQFKKYSVKFGGAPFKGGAVTGDGMNCNRTDAFECEKSYDAGSRLTFQIPTQISSDTKQYQYAGKISCNGVVKPKSASGDLVRFSITSLNSNYDCYFVFE